MYGTQLAKRNLVACEMAITSKVRYVYMWEYSVPFTAQSLILFMLATLKTVSVACSDELVSGSSDSSCSFM